MPEMSRPIVPAAHGPPYLANEIWNQVFSYLPSVSDLKNLRLVDSRFEILAATPLFHTIHVAFYPMYLDRLTAIASLPHLRFSVRKIMFDGEVLDNAFLDFDKWYCWLNQGPMLDQTEDYIWDLAYKTRNRELLNLETTFEQLEALKNDEVFNKEMRKHHRQVTRLIMRQKGLLSATPNLPAMTAAIQSFHGLTTVRMNARGKGDYISGVPCRERRGFPPSLIAQILLNDKLLYNIHCEDVDDEDMAKPFVFCLESIAANGAVQVLSCHEVPWNFWHRKLGTFDWAGLDAKIPKGLSSLRELNLILESGNWGDFREKTPGWRLWSFLQGANRLEVLSLQFDEYVGVHDPEEPLFGRTIVAAIEYDYVSSVSPLFECLALPNLRTLQLHACVITQDGFIKCIRAHASTLKNLKLGDIQLMPPTKGGWEAAFFGAALFSKLENFALKDIRDAERHFDGNYVKEVLVTDHPWNLMHRAASSLGTYGYTTWRISVGPRVREVSLEL